MTASALNLKGKVALVTGSTSGIGLGIARALAASGADIALNGFGDAAVIGQLRQQLSQEFKVAVHYHGADMSQPAQIADMVQSTASTLGSVEKLVNNARIQ